MPQVRYTSDGDMYYIPDDVPANSLYPTNTDQQNNDLEQYAKSLPLPVAFDNPLPTHNEYKPTGGQKLISILTGGNDTERYQFWPEKMVRSAVTLPHDVMTGQEPVLPQYGDESSQDKLIERTQDLAGLAGVGPLGVKPGTASVGSGMIKPRTFWRGENLGDTRRIKTGNENWDNNLFVSSNKDAALMYGKDLKQYEALPEAKILYEGTQEFTNVSGKWRKGESLLDYSARASEAAKQAGYDAIHFKRQGDVGTAIFNPDKFKLLSDTSANAPLSALEHAPAFYSVLENTVKNAKMNKGSADQWLGYLKNNGVKNEEIEHVLGELPKGQITKQELENIVAQNKIELGEVNKGKDITPDKQAIEKWQSELDAAKTKVEELSNNNRKVGLDFENGNITREEWQKTNKEYMRQKAEVSFIENRMKEETIARMGGLSDPKYSKWQLPNGENYREQLLTLPKKPTADGIPEGYEIINETKAARNAGFNVPADAPDTWTYRGPGIGSRIFKTREEALADAQRYAVNNDNAATFTSSHWSEPNVLAHIRMNDRFIPDANGPSINQTLANPKGWHITPPDQTVSGKWMVKSNDYNSKGFHFNTKEEAEANLAQNIAGERPNSPRLGDKGLKSLHIEEIQSDWHQKGRKEGYKGEKEALQPKFDTIEKKIVDSGDEHIMGQPELADALKAAVDKKIITADEAKTYKRYVDIENSSSPVPDAPFKSNWSDLALKKIIRQAAEGDYDAISFTPGEAQAARYDLSKQINKIHFVKDKDGISLSAEALNGNGKVDINDGNPIPENKIADHIGKEAADKIIEILNNKSSKKYGTLENVDLKIGGEGMKAFYDKMLVDKVNSLVKKFGGKVEQSNLPSQNKYELKQVDGDWTVFENGKVINEFGSQKEHAQKYLNEKQKEEPIHILKLTPELKNHVLKHGFPLFSASPVLVPVDNDPWAKSKIKLIPVKGNPFAP